MIGRTIWLGSFLCCALVIASFALFAVDQMSSASATQQRALDGSAAPSAPAAPTVHRGQPRRFIDEAAHKLTSPFSSIVSSTNQWVEHGVPLMVALAVYGLGLGFLARYTSGLS